MDAVQLDFINQLVPQPRANAPMSPEQKWAFLTSHTKRHSMEFSECKDFLLQQIKRVKELKPPCSEGGVLTNESEVRGL